MASIIDKTAGSTLELKKLNVSHAAPVMILSTSYMYMYAYAFARIEK